MLVHYFYLLRMSESVSDNRRIAKNTIYLYIRMFITMIVGLFTARIVLSALGVSDYGLNNVVGGLVTMMPGTCPLPSPKGSSTLIPAVIADYDIIPLNGKVRILDAFIDNMDRSIAGRLSRFIHIKKKDSAYPILTGSVPSQL